MVKKKTFVTTEEAWEDPALAFLSQESFYPPIDSDQPKAKGAEIKSRRVQLVLQPSLYQKVKQASIKAGLSFNEYCCQILEDAVKY